MVDTAKIADWLDETIDSHTVYDTDVLAELQPLGVEYDAKLGLLTAGDKSVGLGATKMGVLVAQSGAAETGNPKGLYPEPGYDPEKVVFAGYWLSAALDKLLTGENAGGKFMGRGSAHRACVAHIRGTVAEPGPG